ncbi:membrane protein [Streptomyces anulatus]
MLESSSAPQAMNFTQGLEDGWSKIANFVPELAAFLVVLVIGWIISKALSKVIDRVLRKVGTEKIADRAGVAALLNASGYDLTALVCRIVYYGLLLITLQAAFGVFGSNPVSDMIDSIVVWLPNLVIAVVLAVVAMAIANVVRSLIAATLAGLPYGKTVATAVWAAIAGLGVIAALGQAGIATTVTQPVLYAILASAAGILVVGVGGGLILPMSHRWKRWLDSADQEAERMRTERDSPAG